MTMVILSEGIDLSLGPMLSLCGVVLAVYLHKGAGIFQGILIVLAVGAVAGAVNGFFIAKAKLPPFVVTFGNMGMCTGVALVITQGSSIPGFGDSFKFIANGSLLHLPFPVLILALMVLITYILLYHTRFGTYVFSIGGNQEAVRLAGVNAVFFKAMIYVVAGTYAGVGALIMTSRMNAAHPLVGFGMEFEAIASVILGGTSFVMGKGSPFRSLVGATTIAVLKNGMNLVGVHPALQVAFVGAFLIMAVIYDSIKGE
jgi:ribose transport system permease protein